MGKERGALKMKLYNVTVKYKSGSESVFPDVAAKNKEHARNRVIYELWKRGAVEEDIKTIKAEIAENHNSEER
jgi:hypothetical protein